ncbi:MAG: hypothetical protein DDT39_01453 [Firmicutes bacterium]|nr:hypothetical protein [candidate division NPL-UPA2 bacterium]
MRTHAYLGVVAQRVVLEGVGYTVVANSLQAVVVIRVGVNDAILGSCLKAPHGIVGVTGGHSFSIGEGLQQALELVTPIVGHSLTTGVGNGLGVVTARGVTGISFNLKCVATHVSFGYIAVSPSEVVDYVFGAGRLGDVATTVLVFEFVAFRVKSAGEIVIGVIEKLLFLLGQVLC